MGCLDMNFHSLEIIDEAAEKLWPHYEDDYELSGEEVHNQPPRELFAELVALVGEVLVHTFNGRWRMAVFQTDPIEYEPIVEIDDGEFHFAGTVYKHLYKYWTVDAYWTFAHAVPPDLKRDIGMNPAYG
jgi:hypothetical protein